MKIFGQLTFKLITYTPKLYLPSFYVFLFELPFSSFFSSQLEYYFG
jgi:hypothetical protein